MESHFRVVVTPEAERLLKKLDSAVFQIIQNAVRKLKSSPQLGKPLTGKLKGLLSWKISRYRVVYTFSEENKTIVIAGAGIRKEGDKKDVYNLLQRLKSKGLLENLIRYVEEQ